VTASSLRDRRVGALEEPADLAHGSESLRGIKVSERAHALDHGDLCPLHTCEVKFRVGDSAGALEDDFILGFTGDFAGELLQLFCQCRA
jgi:hypothetical protein